MKSSKTEKIIACVAFTYLVFFFIVPWIINPEAKIYYLNKSLTYKDWYLLLQETVLVIAVLIIAGSIKFTLLKNVSVKYVWKYVATMSLILFVFGVVILRHINVVGIEKDANRIDDSISEQSMWNNMKSGGPGQPMQ